MRRLIIIPILLLLLFTACNKEKRFSKRLMQREKLSGVWLVSELSVDGTNETTLPLWSISDCDIYEDTCQGNWQVEADEADFVWQFQDKGKQFLLQRIDGADSCDFVTHISELQCYNYSGTYEVVKAKRKEMILESESTVGYSGKKVKIVLERQ